MNPGRLMDHSHKFGQNPNNMMGGSRMNQEMYEDGMDSRDGRAGGNFDRFPVGGGEDGRGPANALGPMFTIGSQGPGNMQESSEPRQSRRW